MPDENGFATPEERGDFVPEDADGGSETGTPGVGDPDSAGDVSDDSTDDSGAVVETEGEDTSDDASGAGSDESADDGAPTDDSATADGDASASADSEDAESADAEGDTSGEADSEGDAEPAAEAKGTPRRRRRRATSATMQRIPKPRFDEKIRQVRAAHDRIKQLEEENARLKAGDGQNTGPTLESLGTQLAEKTAEIAAAVKDGEADKIVELMNDQQALQSQITDMRIAQATENSTAYQNEQADFLAVKAEAEAQLPFLDPKSDEYDQEEVNQVSGLVQTFQKAGQTSGDALVQAINLLYPEMDDEPAAEKQEEKPAAGAQRKKEAIKKNIAAKKKSPPANLADAGEDGDKHGLTKQIDVTKLTEEEFDALPPETLKRLRGDYV